MRIKKLLCVVLAAAMSSLIVFSGCNTPQTAENSDVSESSLQQSSAENSETSENSKENSNQGSQESSEQESSSDDEQITPAVWKVTSADGEDYMYMMGSIHIADESVDNMPDYFEEIYTECDALAVEVNINDAMDNLTSSAYQMMSQMVYTDGTTIKDHISEDTYNKAVELLEENNLYSSLYDYYIPYMWVALIENMVYEKSGLDTDHGVDTVLIERAENDDKEVLEVESFEMQLELLTGFSDELQEMMLASYLEEGVIDAQAEATKQLYEKWKTGTITAEDVSDEIDEENMTEEEKALVDEYNNALVDERNIGMADKAEEYIKSEDTVLMVVGAAHFYGDSGILQLMEDRGYTITQITSVDQLEQLNSEVANAA